LLQACDQYKQQRQAEGLAAQAAYAHPVAAAMVMAAAVVAGSSKASKKVKQAMW
jgi:hypothetical protein